MSIKAFGVNPSGESGWRIQLELGQLGQKYITIKGQELALTRVTLGRELVNSFKF